VTTTSSWQFDCIWTFVFLFPHNQY